MMTAGHGLLGYHGKMHAYTALAPIIKVSTNSAMLESNKKKTTWSDQQQIQAGTG